MFGSSFASTALCSHLRYTSSHCAFAIIKSRLNSGLVLQSFWNCSQLLSSTNYLSIFSSPSPEHKHPVDLLLSSQGMLITASCLEIFNTHQTHVILIFFRLCLFSSPCEAMLWNCAWGCSHGTQYLVLPLWRWHLPCCHLSPLCLPSLPPVLSPSLTFSFILLLLFIPEKFINFYWLSLGSPSNLWGDDSLIDE